MDSAILHARFCLSHAQSSNTLMQGVKTAINGLTSMILQDYPKELPADAKVGFTVINQVTLTAGFWCILIFRVVVPRPCCSVRPQTNLAVCSRHRLHEHDAVNKPAGTLCFQHAAGEEIRQLPACHKLCSLTKRKLIRG